MYFQTTCRGRICHNRTPVGRVLRALPPRAGYGSSGIVCECYPANCGGIIDTGQPYVRWVTLRYRLTSPAYVFVVPPAPAGRSLVLATDT